MRDVIVRLWDLGFYLAVAAFGSGVIVAIWLRSHDYLFDEHRSLSSWNPISWVVICSELGGFLIGRVHGPHPAGMFYGAVLGASIVAFGAIVIASSLVLIIRLRGRSSRVP